MKAFGISMTSNVPAATTKSNANMLESQYSKTFIYTPQTKDVEVKEVLELIPYLIEHLEHLAEIENSEISEKSISRHSDHIRFFCAHRFFSSQISLCST